MYGRDWPWKLRGRSFDMGLSGMCSSRLCIFLFPRSRSNSPSNWNRLVIGFRLSGLEQRDDAIEALQDFVALLIAELVKARAIRTGGHQLAPLRVRVLQVRS